MYMQHDLCAVQLSQITTIDSKKRVMMIKHLGVAATYNSAHKVKKKVK